MEITAVEWFFNELSEVERNLINQTFLQNNKTLAGNTLRGLFEQAKEMEKQQRQKDFKAGNECACMGHENIEDYFNEYIKSK